MPVILREKGYEFFFVMFDNQGHSRSVVVPISIPDLDDVRLLAERLHSIGRSYRGRAWGWDVTYEPEMNEPEADVEVPDGAGGFRTEVMPLWTPASFTIGESGVWFFSRQWENGADQAPVEFLDERNIVEQASTPAIK